jgi:hypothetical protein
VGVGVCVCMNGVSGGDAMAKWVCGHMRFWGVVFTGSRSFSFALIYKRLNFSTFQGG